jgi:hypothetical protein
MPMMQSFASSANNRAIEWRGTIMDGAVVERRRLHRLFQKFIKEGFNHMQAAGLTIIELQKIVIKDIEAENKELEKKRLTRKKREAEKNSNN